ncbi:AIP3-domain-containing protein [Thelephora ganbajun]|uniref:AIP3-domain-containing protein n=1 Tax=Thelephora ganbajun TaxID=370292 RepID=A0ACB6ZI52_THEGA|nr:AIP3-domain-containing protein [Thelephora ganbajun]
MMAAPPPYQVNPQDTPVSTPTMGPRSERSSRSGNSPAVETAVTRLLVSIKALLESLTKWSDRQISDMDVSDVYVRLGNDFNAAVAAFAAYNIEMKELHSVPEDLRNILETCLAEDAQPENLQRYLPDVRKIITNLLQGLRGKQTAYRKIISEQKHRSDASGHSRHESRSSVRSSRRDTVNSQRSFHRSNTDAARMSGSSLGRTVTSSRRNPSVYGIDSPPRPPLVEESDDGGFVGGFVAPPQPPNVGDIGLGSPSSTPPSRHVSTNGHPFHDDDARSTSSRVSMNRSASSPIIPPAQTPQQSPVVPATVKRYSLVDKPMSIPSVVVDDAPESPDPGDGPASLELPAQHAPFESPGHEPLPAPAIANSLAALKQSDTLERRASKRFSTYNITKMTGSRIGGAGNRKSIIASSSALTPGELAVLTEVEEGPGPVTPRKRERSTRKARQPPIQEQDEDVPPPVPTVPATESAKEESVTSDTQSETQAHVSPKPLPSAPNQPFTVFMQVGREVKKATVEPGLTMAMLRVLFMDKFSYSPGMDSFPAIYIRDGSSGIQYELEDMDEIKEKCLLSLNIEPLDQIKQHIDTQISNLSNDIKDLRVIVANTKRVSNPPMILGRQLVEEPSHTAARPTDKQFQRAAGRLSRIYSDGSPVSSKPDGVPESPTAPVSTHMTGASMVSFAGGEVTTRIVGDLRTQFDEVQNLRRDLGVVRQLYSEFMKSTKDTLGSLRNQTQTVRQLASARVSGARSYIEDGKAKLDTRSQNVLTKMEELQDTVESVKGDVLKRHVSPRPQVLKAIKADIGALANELTSLKDHITTVKPMWKKTWEEELQMIVEEQQFLSHQEEFLADLQEDHKAVLEIYGHVEKVISLRGSGAGKAAGRSRQLARQVTGEADPGSLGNVMAEIRGNSVDPNRRLKAIAANEKSREKEKASQSDEFQAELSGFVGGKKLKMTGGAEEADRVRQKRNDQTLKAMFTGGSPSPTH